MSPHTVVAGSLIIVIERREADDDGGLSVSLLVWDKPFTSDHKSPSWKAVWRADLFRQKPHYHFFREDGEKFFRIEGYPDLETLIEWCMTRLTNIGQLLSYAGYTEAEAIDTATFRSHLTTVRKWLVRLAAD